MELNVAKRLATWARKPKILGSSPATSYMQRRALCELSECHMQENQTCVLFMWNYRIKYGELIYQTIDLVV